LGIAEPALRPYAQELVAALLGAPYLTRFPASLDPSPFVTTLRYRPPPLGEVGESPPLPDWWGGRTTPLLYVTFGTVIGYLQDAPDRFRAALEAVSGLEARVLMTVGRKLDPGALGAIPDNVHVEAWVPQHQVFGHASVVVCHGGSGTVLGALAAGLPVVAVPVFGDQFANGQRVVGAGAGVSVEAARAGSPATTPLPLRLRQSILDVLGDSRYQEAAERIATEMAGEATVDETLDALVVSVGG
jgi:MGT family glycosyltransferase